MTYNARIAGRKKIGPDDFVDLHDSELSGADFSGRKLVHLSVAGSRLVRCRFDKVRATASLGGGRTMSRFIDCSFDGARLVFGSGGYARFERCSFRDVDLRHWFCFAVELVDCTFTGRLRKAVFNGTVPEEQRAAAGRSRNEFAGNDFSGMDLADVAFRTGIDLSLQRLPSGPTYLYLADAARAVQRARVAVTGWEDLALRREAMPLISVLELETAGGQRQLLLRKDNYPGPREVTDLVFGLLAGD